MIEINKNDVILLENATGGRVALQVQKDFSSRILYRQVASNGGLDFTKTRDNVLKKRELERYKVKKCEDVEEAEHLTHQDVESECVEAFDELHD